VSKQVRAIIACSFFIIAVAPSEATSQTGDFNGDSFFDCLDIQLLRDAIRAGSGDPTFDLNGDGTLSQRDVDWWLAEAGAARGFDEALLPGDANLDGRIDRFDANVMGIHWRSPATNGWCEGDFSFQVDGTVDPTDRGFLGINWQNYLAPLPPPPPPSPAAVVELPTGNPIDIWAADNGIVFAETEQFQLASVPQPAPDGLLASILEIRSKSPTQRPVSIDNLAVSGPLHQVWDHYFGSPTTPHPWDFDELPADWAAADSHMMLHYEDIAFDIGGGYRVEEENDQSNLLDLDSQLTEAGDHRPLTGLGELRMPLHPSMFALSRETQSKPIQLAYLVVPAVMPETGGPGEIVLTLGILGADDQDTPLPDEGIIGLDEPVRFPFFPEPCDFDSDGRCDVTDLDLLLSVRGNADPRFDLDRSGSIIDLADRDEWLRLSGEQKLGEPFVVGDIDLDGDVDAADLNELAVNWRQTDLAGWSHGDFNSDGVIDASDLNGLAVNWQHGVPATAVVTVPEPAGVLLLGMIALTALVCDHRHFNGQTGRLPTHGIQWTAGISRHLGVISRVDSQ
jgi:hypothetical protein